MLDFLGIISVVSAGTATCLNALLLPIIALKSGQNIGTYKVLLFLNTFSATIYSATHAVVIPAFYVEKGKYILFSENTLLPVDVGIALIFLFALDFASIVLCLSLSFLYRLSAMTNVPSRTWFETPTKILLIVIFSISVFFAAESTIIIALWPSEAIAAAFEEGFKRETGFSLYEIGYMGCYAYDPLTGEVDKGLLLSLSIFGAIALFGVLCMLYCTIKLISAFRSQLSQLETNTKCVRHQKKLFILLCLQAAFPLVFTLSPPLICFACAFLKLSPGPIPTHAGSIMAIATVAEPLLVVYFISDYRNFIRRILGGKVVASSVHPTSKVTTGQN